MKQFTVFYLLAMLSFSAFAQSPSWAWVKNDQANQFSSGYEIMSDGAGNLIVSGTFQNKIVWDGDTLYQSAPIHTYGQFVMSIKGDGSLNWMRQVGGSNEEQTVRIAIDHDNDVYALAFVKDSLVLTDTTINGRGAYLYKFTPNGERQLLFSLPDGCSQLAVNNQKDIYLGGTFNDSLNIGGQSVIASVYQQLFLAKFDSFLNFEWLRDFGLGDFNKLLGISCNELGEIYINGAFGDSIKFGTTTLHQNSPSGCSSCAVFLASLNSEGNVEWAWNGNNIMGDVLVDRLGNVAISGYFSNTGYISNVLLPNEVPAGQKNLYVASINGGNGTLMSSEVAGALRSNFSVRTAMDTNDNYYVSLYGIDTAFIPPYVLSPLPFSAGEYKGNMVVAKFDSTGAVQWAKNAQTSYYSYNRLRGIATMPDGGVYVTGVTAGDAFFEGITLPTGPSSLGQMFVAKLDQTTGLQPLNGRPSRFSVYPNPANQVATVSWEGKASSLAIYDVTGRHIHRQSISDNQQTVQLALSSYASGLYYIRLSSATGSRTQKLVIAK